MWNLGDEEGNEGFVLMGWPKSPFVFSCKIKDTFFIFTNNFIGSDILSMWLSSAWCNIDCSQLMSQFDCYQLQLVYPTVEHHPARNLQHGTSQTTFDMFNQSQHLLHMLHRSFFVFQLCLYLSWNNKAEYAEMLLIFFHFQC